MIYLPEKADIPGMLAALVRPGDLSLFLGRRRYSHAGRGFLRLLQERSAVR